MWTNDLRRGHRLANRIETGMLWLNSHNVRDLRTPFGGVKESGLGREGGEHSLDFFTDTTIVHVALGDTHVPRFGLPVPEAPTPLEVPWLRSPITPTWSAACCARSGSPMPAPSGARAG